MNTILICEDETELRLLLSQFLHKQGYNVICAERGEACLELLKQHDTIDLVLLDIIMPGIDGYETLTQLRRHTNVPVIMLTACGEESQKIKGLQLGADDYVVKPFSFKEVQSRIAAQLRRSKEYLQTSDEWLRNGPLAFNRTSQELIFKDQPLHLSAKERALLIHFLKNVGVIFTKKQLYENVWQEIYRDNDNTLTVHLSHLREKIEPRPKHPEIIKTIRCVGYRMEQL